MRDREVLNVFYSHHLVNIHSFSLPSLHSFIFIADAGETGLEANEVSDESKYHFIA